MAGWAARPCPDGATAGPGARIIAQRPSRASVGGMAGARAG
ncbi:hypothetical protein [Skermanella rosea]|nr:hypothetical protein [Skermanella rosea]